MPVFLDLTHTSHTRACTGIQRVTRSLHTALGAASFPVTHDPYLRAWRPLEPWEQANLTATEATEKRGATWPFAARVRGHTRRLLGRAPETTWPSLPAPSDAPAGIIVPEVFSAKTAAAFPALFATTAGPRVAVFHDAIALKYPELTPTKTVARFPSYLRELLAFDGIAAVSEDSRDSLRDYWRWLGLTDTPPVEAIPLGLDLPSRPTIPPSTLNAEPPTLLSVGSLEGRKNHVALLDACEQLWSHGTRFTLHLIGLAHPETGRDALARVRALQAAGRPLRYDGPATDAALSAAYAGCTFTVYPSLIEGFGLPVIESLAHGKPCICSSRGALGESTRGGGCYALDRVDASALAAAIFHLLTAPGELPRLSAAARARTFRSWADYASALTTWMNRLPLRR